MYDKCIQILVGKKKNPPQNDVKYHGIIFRRRLVE